jgi:hypothetical protein
MPEAMCVGGLTIDALKTVARLRSALSFIVRSDEIPFQKK